MPISSWPVGELGQEVAVAPDPHADARVARAQSLHRARQPAQRQDVVGAHAQRADLAVLQAVEPGVERGDLTEDALAVDQQALAGLGGDHAPAGAQERWTPSRASSSRSCWLSADCVSASSPAARVIVPCRAIALTSRRWRSSSWRITAHWHRLSDHGRWYQAGYWKRPRQLVGRPLGGNQSWMLEVADDPDRRDVHRVST